MFLFEYRKVHPIQLVASRPGWRPPFRVCTPFASSLTPVPVGLGPVTMDHGSWDPVTVRVDGFRVWKIFITSRMKDFGWFGRFWKGFSDGFFRSAVRPSRLKHVTRLFHPNPFASTRPLPQNATAECGQNRLNVQCLPIGKLQKIHLSLTAET